MKKEKTVKSYTRKTKSGKVVTVRQHTAKYDAAKEAQKEMAKKKGAGSELEGKKKVSPDPFVEIPKAEWDVFMEYIGEATDNAEIASASSRKQLHTLMKKEGENIPFMLKEYKKLSKKDRKFYEERAAETKQRRAKDKGTQPEEKKKGVQKEDKVKAKRGTKPTKDAGASAKVKGTTKTSEPSHGISQAEFKKWYHWDYDNDRNNKEAKAVASKLRKQMGAKAYNKYFNEISDSYSARGHNKAYKGLSEKNEGDKKEVKKDGKFKAPPGGTKISPEQSNKN